MVQINVNIDSELDNRFREAVFMTKGMKRGSMSQAIHEALALWILQSKNKKMDFKTRSEYQ